MIEPIRFSVVIPLYNKERHIIRAVRSVIEQKYRNFELIVINDGSTDKSLERIENYLDKITLINQINGGESAARNTGIAHSKNSYVAFLDADDEWLPNFLNNISEMIISNPGHKIYCTNYYKKSKRSCTQAISTQENNISLIDYFHIARKGSTPISSSSACLHKSLFEEIGMFPEGIILYPDLCMWTKASIKNPICFHPTPSAIYHRDADNRVCNTTARTNKNTPFENTIAEAKSNKTLTGKRLKCAEEFVCHYKLLNAFKALTNHQKDNATDILKNTKPKTAIQLIKKYSYIIACLFPETALHGAWIASRKILK